MVYPSLSDNNILQKTLVSEVLYKAEQLKKEWLEGQEGEPCDFTFCEQLLPSEAVRQAMEVEEVYMQGSRACVPLLRVWASSTVQALCSSFQQLRAILLVDIQVQLDADRDVIMLPVAYEEEEEDAEQMDEGEKVECMSRSVNDNVEEDWESEL